MGRQVIARFLVDHPIGPGAVRAILDTLTAQGGAYEPQLMRRPPDQGVRRITGARPTRLLDEVGEGGTSTTFLRVSEGSAHPVLSFIVSETPRTSPTSVTLNVPEDALASSKEIEQVLGICKGLYLFLESPWGTIVVADPTVSGEAPEAPMHPRLDWTTFLGPQAVAQLGPAPESPFKSRKIRLKGQPRLPAQRTSSGPRGPLLGRSSWFTRAHRSLDNRKI